MKAFYLFIYAAAAMVLAALLGSCGGRKQTASSADTMAAAEIDSIIGADTLPAYYLTAEGVGPVRVGMEVKDIPEMAPGLYDRVATEDETVAMARIFSNATGAVFTALDFGGGKVDMIYLDNAYVKVSAAEGELQLGDPFSRVLALPGVRAEWEDDGETGLWYWTAGGLWYGVDQSTLTEEAVKRLFSSQTPPGAAGLGSGVQIGYIGTGLPF